MDSGIRYILCGCFNLGLAAFLRYKATDRDKRWSRFAVGLGCCLIVVGLIRIYPYLF